MLWLYLALVAYFINACVFVIDKYLLSSPIPKYHAYAFGVSVLSLTSLFLLPFGVSWYGWSYLVLSLACGAAFFFSLMFAYKTIKESDVSIAATQTGVMGAISTYIFSVIILHEKLHLTNSFAFLFLIVGIFLLGKIEKKIFTAAVISGVSFGLSFVLLKLSFNSSNFINGIFWTRMGFVGSALVSLVSPHVRDEVKFSYNNSPKSSKVLFILNKMLAGVGFIILYFSIRLGDVSLVNALLGLQFMFTFILAALLTGNRYGIKENLNKQIIKPKLAGITFVLIGLLILFIQK